MNRPQLARSRELGLTILAIVAAGASVNFFVLGTAGLIPFSEYRNYVLITSFFIILFVAIYGYKKNKRLANRLVTGLWIGIIATLALEAIRVPSIYVHWIPHDDMIALPGKLLTNPPSIDNFNAMIMTDSHGGGKNMMHGNDNMMKMASAADSMKTSSLSNPLQGTPKHKDHNGMNDGMMTDSSTTPNSKINNGHPQQESTKLMISQSGNKNLNMSKAIGDHHNGDQTMMMGDSMQASPLELVIGGLYHFWNGATMAAVYTLVIGRGRWYYGLLWGFVIHIGMMLTPWMIPMVGPFGVDYGSGYTIFVASLLAHLAYGAVLGILAQRFIKDKKTLINIVKSGESRLLS